MQSSSSIAAVAPIVFLALGIGAVNWIDLARGQKRSSVAYPVSLVITLVLAVWFGLNAANGETHYVFGNMAVIDPMANVLASFCALTLFATLVYTRRYLADRDMYAGEFYMFALFTLGGQVVMITGNNFLVLYLGLELLSLASFERIVRISHEVLHPGRTGIGPAAVRHVDAVRRDRLAGAGQGV